MKKLFLLLVCSLFMTGCELKISSIINISDLFSAEHKIIIADLQIETDSCKASNIDKLKTVLQKRGLKATFNTCSDDGWDNYASFSIPISLIKNNNSPITNQSVIYFVSEDGALYLESSEKIETLLGPVDNLSEKLTISKIEFALVNDTFDAVNIETSMVFLNDEPVLSGTYTVQPLSKVLIRLSNVAAQALEQPNTSYRILEFVNTDPSLDTD